VRVIVRHCESLLEREEFAEMHVEAIGQPGRLADIEPGQCFFFESRGMPVFAIYTADEHGHKAAIVFTRK
jgi:hypothetical protein